MDAAEDEIAIHFRGFPVSQSICRTVVAAVDSLGGASVVVSKSQVAFRRRRAFAWVWRPGQYVSSTVPAVLSFALARELVSDRLKSVAHPSHDVWMHHLELCAPGDIDDEVRSWLEEAYRRAA